MTASKYCDSVLKIDSVVVVVILVVVLGIYDSSFDTFLSQDELDKTKSRFSPRPRANYLLSFQLS